MLEPCACKFIMVLFEPFETLSLFILRETTPEIRGPWEELEFTVMGTILLMPLNFLHLLQQIFSLVFPTEVKERSVSSPSCIDSDRVVVVVTFSGL